MAPGCLHRFALRCLFSAAHTMPCLLVIRLPPPLSSCLSATRLLRLTLLIQRSACSYQKGLCAMCGKQILDKELLSKYKQSMT